MCKHSTGCGLGGGWGVSMSTHYWESWRRIMLFVVDKDIIRRS